MSDEKVYRIKAPIWEVETPEPDRDKTANTYHRATLPFVTLVVCDFGSWVQWWACGEPAGVNRVASVEEAKEAAWVWYVERIAPGLKEVKTHADAETIKCLNARIEEDKWKIIGLVGEAARERLSGEDYKAGLERMNAAWERAVNNGAADATKLKAILRKCLDALRGECGFPDAEVAEVLGE